MRRRPGNNPTTWRPAAPHLDVRFFSVTCAVLIAATPAACQRKERRKAAQELEAVPYFGSTPALDQRQGTTFLDRDRVFVGLNLMVEEDGRGAVLFDLEGHVVHHWEAPAFASVFHTVALDAKGALYAAHGPDFAYGFGLDSEEIPRAEGLLALRWDSGVIWDLRGGYTHDIALLDDGSLLAIRDEVRVEEIDGARSVLTDDLIVHVGSAGQVLRELSIYDLFADRIPPARLKRARGNRRLNRWGLGDLIHTNSIAVLDRDVAGLGRAGDWLISMRELDLIAVIDPNTHERRWEYGPGIVRAQHQPTVTPEGTVLVFDNRGNDAASRVIEVEPKAREIVWQYPREKHEAFYSKMRGGVQRLPNGNTLVVLSERGRVIEVTKDEKIVWEYYTPLRAHDPSLRMVPYRVERLTPERAAHLPFAPERMTALREAGYVATADETAR